MDDERVSISSLEALRQREPDVLDRLRAMPNGERLFLIHPLRALADAGFDLSDEAVAEILRLHPNLAQMPTTAYDALQASPAAQSGTVRLDGLFEWERV
jgi:hypothetical protein